MTRSGTRTRSTPEHPGRGLIRNKTTGTSGTTPECVDFP